MKRTVKAFMNPRLAYGGVVVLALSVGPCLAVVLLCSTILKAESPHNEGQWLFGGLGN